MLEQSLLYQILDTAWRKRRSAILLVGWELFAQPGHRPIQMM